LPGKKSSANSENAASLAASTKQWFQAHRQNDRLEREKFLVEKTNDKLMFGSG
jgi:hypothetical protein